MAVFLFAGVTVFSSQNVHNEILDNHKVFWSGDDIWFLEYKGVHEINEKSKHELRMFLSFDEVNLQEAQ